MLTVLRLSFRQIAGGRRKYVALLIAAMPLLVAIIFRSSSLSNDATEFIDTMTTGLLTSPLLALVAAVIGTGAFGNERSDRTLGYLVLTPVSRWSIALAKHIAAIVSIAVTMAIAAGAMSLVAGGSANDTLATMAGMVVGAVAYGALFTWLGLVTDHALVIALIYVFVWETLLASLVAGLAALSIRAYALALIAALRDTTGFTSRLSTQAGIIGCALVTVAALALTVRALRRSDIP